MSILIMNSFRGKNIPYPEWLSSADEPLFLLCSDQQNTESTLYHYAQSFEHYEKNDSVEKAAKLLIQQHNVTTIIAKSECDLLRAGKLRDEFHINGQTYQQALAFRDKVVMKSYLEKAHVRIPAYQRIQNKNDAIKFSQQQGFPLVLKPVDGAGSIDTMIIDNEKTLMAILPEKFKNKMEIEEYISGEMYHVDGMVLNGEIVFIYPSKYFYDCLRYQNNQSSGSCILEYQHPLRERLIEFTKNVLAALPTPGITTFHAEVFHTPADELVFCEIASRTGGVRIRETIQHAFHINLDKAWIQAQSNVLHLKNMTWPSHPTVLAGWILIPPREGILMQFPKNNLPAGIVEYQKNGQLYKQYYQPEKSSDCVASFVAVGDSEEQVISRLKEAEMWFEENAVWQQ